MKKFLLISAFFILNLILSSNIIWIIGYLLILFLLVSPSQPVSIIFLIVYFVILEILAIGKLFLFPFLCQFIYKNRNSEEIFNKKNIAIMLTLAAMSDIVFLYIWYKFNVYTLFFCIFSLGGVFICYLSLIVWFKIKEKSSKICG